MARLLHVLLGVLLVTHQAFADVGDTSPTGTSGGGDDNDGDGGSRDGRDRLERVVQVQVQSNGVHVESVLKAGAQKDKFELDFQTNEFRLGIQLRAQFGSDGNKDSAFFQWKIGNILEYVDSDAVPGYQSGDRVGSVWNFTKQGISWSQLADTTVNGVVVHHFQGQTSDQIFTLLGHVSGGVFTAGPNNSVTITPVATKFDINLNLPNSFWTLAGSRVAIVGWVMSGSKDSARQLDSSGNTVTTSTTDGKRIHFGPDASPSGFFSWDMNPACVDSAGLSAHCPVIVSPLVADPNEDNGGNSDNVNKRTSHSFDRVHPQSINWDPVLGAGTGSGTHAVPSLLALAALVVAALFANLA
jgi:hypothetical protein